MERISHHTEICQHGHLNLVYLVFLMLLITFTYIWLKYDGDDMAYINGFINATYYTMYIIVLSVYRSTTFTIVFSTHNYTAGVIAKRNESWTVLEWEPCFLHCDSSKVHAKSLRTINFSEKYTWLVYEGLKSLNYTLLGYILDYYLCELCKKSYLRKTLRHTCRNTLQFYCCPKFWKKIVFDICIL